MDDEPCASSLGYSVRNSSSSHSSSSSSNSDGLSSPPTFERRSRSAARAAVSCCSFSSAYSSALSPANSFSWMRKSRRLSLNLSGTLFRVKRPSTKLLIWSLYNTCQQWPRNMKGDETYGTRFGNAVCKRFATNPARKSLLLVPAGA